MATTAKITNDIKIPSPHDWRTTDTDEINKRRLRAREESFTISNVDPQHPVFSNFHVASGSGLTYSVEIRDLRQRQFACDCVDFRANGLGVSPICPINFFSARDINGSRLTIAPEKQRRPSPRPSHFGWERESHAQTRVKSDQPRDCPTTGMVLPSLRGGERVRVRESPSSPSSITNRSSRMRST